MPRKISTGPALLLSVSVTPVRWMTGQARLEAIPAWEAEETEGTCK